MRNDLKSLLAIIPTLDAAELASVQSAIKAAQSLGGTPSRQLQSSIDSDDMRVLDAIATFAQGRGIDMTGRDQLRAVRIYGSFKDKVPPVARYVKLVGDRTKQRALLMIGLELLNDDLQKIGLAVTSRSLMTHIHRLPAMINRAFPDYARAGMLSLVIGAYQNVRKK